MPMSERDDSVGAIGNSGIIPAQAGIHDHSDHSTQSTNIQE
jgi:hypothetical protein